VAVVELVRKRQVGVRNREIPSKINALFNDAEIAEIAAHPVILGESTERDAIDLAVSWDRHVDKIDTDRALASSDRRVWTEYDLVAALFQRDFLKMALDRLPAQLRERLRLIVDATDEQFRSYTVDDPSGRIGQVGGVDLAGRGWWWRRVPETGPIAEDLARY
jgi:hypothetical protein